jgi:hypothetical protein
LNSRASIQSPTDPLAAAAYVAELTGDLAAIARRHGFDALGYILDMAQEEARNNLRGAAGPRSE